MRVPEEPVCIHLFRKNPVFTSLHLKSPVHVVPPLNVDVENECLLCLFFLSSHSYIYRKILLIQSKVLSDEQADRDTLVAKLTEIKGLNSLVYTQVSL